MTYIDTATASIIIAESLANGCYLVELLNPSADVYHVTASGTPRQMRNRFNEWTPNAHVVEIDGDTARILI